VAPSCANEQYNLVLQPSKSLILPVSRLSNDNSLKDDDAWVSDGAQEAVPLERMMDQHALVITVHDVAHAVWKLESVRRWLKNLPEEDEKKSAGQKVVIKQEPGVSAAQPSTSTATTTQPLPMQTLINGLPTLLASLNDPAAIRRLVAEIELPGDDENARAGGGRARQRQQQQQEVPDELPSLIRFATKPTDASPGMMTTTAPTMIESEPGLHQANTGPIGKAPPSTTGLTTTRINEKQHAASINNPNLAGVVIKQEPLDDFDFNRRGPTAAAAISNSPADRNHSAPKNPVPSPPRNSIPPSTKGISGSSTKKTATAAAAAAAAAKTKRKQQEMDIAERNRRDGIAWQRQPSHPEDQPLLINENKRQKKKNTPPLPAKTLTKDAAIDDESKNKLQTVPPITAGITPSRYKDLFNKVPNTTATTAAAPYNNHCTGVGNTLPPVRNITRLVQRQRPQLERPRYIINTTLNDGAQVPAPISRRWEHILTRWHGVDVTSFSGEFLVRPLKEISQAPPPNTGFSSWFDSMHDEVDPVVAPPPDEDIDCNARVTSSYFDELNPTIKTYGVFPECTVKIPATLSFNGETDVGGNPAPSNLKSSENGHIKVATNGVNAHHPKQQKQQEKQKQLPLPSKNAQEVEKGRGRPVSTDYHSKSDNSDYEDDDYSDEYEDDSRSRSTYSNSRSRSRSCTRSRSRSRSLSLERDVQQGSEVLPPKVWIDHFKKEPNRPRASHCRLERPSECIWQLESSSRVFRSSPQWQENCFDPVWRYEMRLFTFLLRKKNHTTTMECLFDEHPLPQMETNYYHDFKTFFRFMSSRSHLFEITREDDTNDDYSSLIRLRSRASSLLEWKRRMLDYIKTEGRHLGFRVPLAEALLASPFPRDALEEEVRDAKRNIHGYIISLLGDAVYVIQPKMWTNASVSYPYVTIASSRLHACVDFSAVFLLLVIIISHVCVPPFFIFAER